MEKALEKELEKMEMEYHIHVIREDLKGDRLQSAKLVKAAYESNWKEVETLLEQGADPKICRYGDAIDKKSALYFAMVAEQFDLAEKLYDAGDRLDDVIPDEDEKIPARALHFLSHEMRWGKNYFYDPGKPLSECRSDGNRQPGRVEQKHRDHGFLMVPLFSQLRYVCRHH